MASGAADYAFMPHCEGVSCERIGHQNSLGLSELADFRLSGLPAPPSRLSSFTVGCRYILKLILNCGFPATLDR